MHAQSKQSKGSVGIESFQGRLRLRLPRSLFNGKQKYLTLGLPDTKDNRRIAEIKAKAIEHDILYEKFDRTLNKYRPEHLRIVESTGSPSHLNDIRELYKRFSDTKKDSVRPGTWKNGYLVTQSHIANCPHSKLDDAQGIFDWAIGNLTPDTAKRLMMQLSAACKWGMKSGLVSSNPFEGMSADIKVEKRSTEDNDIDPFNKEEREMIIAAFESSRYYSVYAPYVKFLFWTGCRPSEAIALHWEQIHNNQIVFDRAVVDGVNGLELVYGLKTQEKRSFPLNEKLRGLLSNIRGSETPEPKSLIFPSPKGGGFIDIGNFRNRAWTKVLEGLNIRYRKPYQMRHTFITECLHKGIQVKQVAKWAGNSPEVILEHYAGMLDNIQVPEL